MSSPAPPTMAPTAREEFLAAVRAAEIVSATQLTRIAASIPRSAVSAPETARALVESGLLTKFQAERLLSGRPDGLVLGPYVIQEQIGRGVSGRVFRAKHRTMNRPVAIKMLSASLTRTAADRQALQREIRAAAQLNHPNIVTAYDANDVGGQHYLIVEYVEGPNLETLVRERGPLPFAEGCELIYQAALGLAHAHGLGMVHQNLKPSNVLLTPASKSNPAFAVKIADFGVGKLTPLFSAPPDAALGSPDFVAPELIHNRHRADHRGDLYSLGAVLYFLLTGLSPFPGGTADEKIRRHLLEEPMRIDRLRPDVHPDVAALIHQLLAKNAKARPATALEVVNQLDTLFGAISNGVSFELPTPPDGNASYIPGQISARIRLAEAVRTRRHHPSAASAAADHAPETSSWEQITGRHDVPGSLEGRGYPARTRARSGALRVSSLLAGMLVVGAAALAVAFKVMAK